MRELTTEEKAILDQHALWLSSGGAEGERADLHGADLHGANLCGINLRWGDLSHTDLSGASLQGANLCCVDLRYANLQCADLRNSALCSADLSSTMLCGANLRRADMYSADLRCADLQGADLRGANLREAGLDFSCWPLWCGSNGIEADDRLVAQLLWHVTRLNVGNCSGGVQEAIEHIRSMGIADLFCEYRDDVS